MSIPAPRSPGLRSDAASAPAAPVLVRHFAEGAQARLSPPWAVVRPHGEVDLATASGFRQAVASVLRAAESPDTPPVRHCVVDLREVTFLDSSGLSVLAMLVRDAPARACSISLVGVRPLVRTLLRVTGLLAILPERDPRELPEPAQLVLD